MHLNHVTLPILLQVLTTTALSIHITDPVSLFQDRNTTSIRLPRPNPTNRYYVECERVSDPGLPGLNPSNCLVAVPLICDWLANVKPGHFGVERWIWIERPGCALGYFVPRNDEHQALVLPSEEECNKDVYGEIIERCAFDSRYNTGSINVERLPKGREDPGRGMTYGFPRYVMAPASLSS